MMTIYSTSPKAICCDFKLKLQFPMLMTSHLFICDTECSNKCDMIIFNLGLCDNAKIQLV